MAAGSAVEPQVRTWEIKSDSSLYDCLVAAPSDADIQIMFWIQGSVAVVLAGLLGIVLAALCHDRERIRQNPFNLYMVGMLVPDLLFAVSSALTSLSSLAGGGHVLRWHCSLQSWVTVFVIGSRGWVGVAAASEIKKLLLSSRLERRYIHPENRKIVCRIALIFAFVAVLSSLSLITKMPHHTTRLIAGFYCMPMEFSQQSSFFFWLFFWPLMFGLPSLYATWILVRIFGVPNCSSTNSSTRQLLPDRGRRRQLSTFISTMVATYMVVWWPFIACFFLLRRHSNPWISWGGVIWVLVSMILSTAYTALVARPDLRSSIVKFATCQSQRVAETSSNAGNSTSGVPQRRASFVIALPTGVYTPTEFFAGHDASSMLPRQLPGGFEFVDEIGRVPSKNDYTHSNRTADDGVDLKEESTAAMVD